jgi:hypothetical protein
MPALAPETNPPFRTPGNEINRDPDGGITIEMLITAAADEMYQAFTWFLEDLAARKGLADHEESILQPDYRRCGFANTLRGEIPF